MFPTFCCVCLFFFFRVLFCNLSGKKCKRKLFFFLFEKKNSFQRQFFGNHFVKKKLDKLLGFFSFFESKIYTCTCIKNKSIDLISISNPVKITKEWNKIFVELDRDPTVKKNMTMNALRDCVFFLLCAVTYDCKHCLQYSSLFILNSVIC